MLGARRFLLKWVGRLALLCIVLVGLGTAALAAFVPAVLAAVCPSCYGMQPLIDRAFIEKDASNDQRRAAIEAIKAGYQRAEAFFGPFTAEAPEPTLLICASFECDKRLGGKGAKAVTYGAHVVRVAPDGVSVEILSHELAHAAFNRRLLAAEVPLQNVPAWFHEGVAVIISEDARYLQVSPPSPPRCLEGVNLTVDHLPSAASEWGRRAGEGAQPLYAAAACETLKRMGGAPSLSALDQAVKQLTE